jgi:putative tryptophan/tyrosine transport system substrate-binding protein
MASHIGRRKFLATLGAAASAWPLAARAQQPMPVIGYFSARSPVTDGPMLSAFRQGLNDTGFVEGRNVAMEFRWAEGRDDRLLELAHDLVRRRVAVIITTGGESTARAVKAATSTIPIIFISGIDPVESGLVASLNRPGGNLTGVSSILLPVIPKQIGLLSELAPNAILMGALIGPATAFRIAELEDAGRAVGRRLIILKASTDADIDVAFEAFIQQRVQALLVGPGPLFVTRMDRLVAFAARHSLPAMYSRRELVDAGGLVSYASSTAEGYRQMGIYAGRILKGEKPSELPVVQPTRFELVINLKTARALGLDVPPTLLARADEVIE